MTKLNEEQTKKATELIGKLCKSNNLDNSQIAEFFDNDDDEAMLICKYLQSKDLLKIVPAQVNKIAGIDKRDETCNTFKNNMLMKDFEERERNEEIKRLEIELAKSNIEANKLNADIAKKNDKNKMSNNIATWINVSVGIINLAVIIWQLMKAE